MNEIHDKKITGVELPPMHIHINTRYILIHVTYIEPHSLTGERALAGLPPAHAVRVPIGNYYLLGSSKFATEYRSELSFIS